MSTPTTDTDGPSLLGGPLHRLGQRLGLVLNGSNSVPLGLAIGSVLWLGVVLLALIEGHLDRIFSLSAIGGHVRLLVAIPLFFYCETIFAPRMALLGRYLRDAGIVTAANRPALDARFAAAARRADSRLPDLACLIAAGVMTYLGPSLELPGAATAQNAELTAAAASLTGQWFWLVCMTVFRFLLLRWLWRLAQWTYLLWTLVRLELHLVPTHPDGSGGLGYLGVIQVGLSPLVFAFSAIECSLVAEELSVGTMTFDQVLPQLGVYFSLVALLVVAPLLLFYPKLQRCRARGMSDYMVLASNYVDAFERRWLRGGTAGREELLGSADLQSLADLNNSVAIVRDMHLVPVGARTLIELGAAAVIPALPLLLFKYPLSELLQTLFSRLSGL